MTSNSNYYYSMLMRNVEMETRSSDGSFSSGRVTPLHQNTNGTASHEAVDALSPEAEPSHATLLVRKEGGKHDGHGNSGSNQNGVAKVNNYGSTGSGKLPLNGRNTSSGSGSVQAVVAEDYNPKVHAQCLLLAVAFACAWSPQNLMAPNLTQIGDMFHYTPEQRDLFLGSNIFFATAVLSLPISGLIGLYADLVESRKQLYAYTIIVGGIASIISGYAPSYEILYWARFINGGCMAGCVPVAFSLLGDLFHAKHRNAASSALTSMMGAGIIFGQVYAGIVGPKLGWRHPFYVCGIFCIASALVTLVFVEDPIRGGKEEVLQDIIRRGARYDKKLTWNGFKMSIKKSKSNRIIMWQSFFSSVPWGILFCFLNDYLSQERGLSVPNATFLVMVFGFGCAVGGMLGGWVGQVTTRINRSYMPIFMSLSTLIGILPFVYILNANYTSAGLAPCIFAFLSGCIPSLPSVNVRPVLINVNPPETRGATLTAANLIINTARGIGPSFVTLIQTFGHTRQYAFNFLMTFFWIVTSIQLLLLAKTLPADQDRVDEELKIYADNLTGKTNVDSSFADDDLDSIVSIEERMTNFDQHAARESLTFMTKALLEISRDSMSSMLDMGSGDNLDTSSIKSEASIPEVSWSPPGSKANFASYYLSNTFNRNNRDKRWQDESMTSLPTIV